LTFNFENIFSFAAENCRLLFFKIFAVSFQLPKMIFSKYKLCSVVLLNLAEWSLRVSGCVTPIESGAKISGYLLKTALAGVSRIETFDVSDCKVKMAAEIKNSIGSRIESERPQARSANCVPLALAAARRSGK
jgi:hypothetical protein